MADRDDKLADMHDLLCREFLDRLENGEEIVTKDGTVRVKARAATMNVIRQFLKDNGFDAIPTADSPLEKLAQAAGEANVLPFQTPKKEAK